MRLPLFILVIALNSITAFANCNASPYLANVTASAYFGDTIIIPFDYKQSTLYHRYTFEVIDSIINILLNNEQITLSIAGYAFPTEGNDTICKYLSLNRALVIRDYILGSGVDASKIIYVKGMGKIRPIYHGVDKLGHDIKCRVELMLNYPTPPPIVKIADRDGDGIPDSMDACPDEFGYVENKGCPNKNVIQIPFETNQHYLHSLAYNVLDTLINLLKANPSYTISIQGHAYKTEGATAFCNRLAIERASVVNSYLLSRQISPTRIISVKALGNDKPLNAGNTPKEIMENSRTEIFLNYH